MWIDLLPQMREALRAALPERAFLRRDRGNALFVSNAPAFDPEIRDIPGFILDRQDMILRILPDESWIAELEAGIAEPPDALCRSLLRFRGTAPEREGLLLFARGLKLLDAGPSASEHETESFDCALRQRAACALRGGCGGGLYICAVLLNQIRQGE